MAEPNVSEGPAGLPQFEPEWFASQLFWLAVSFGLLYWLLSQALLPQISGIMEARARKIRDDVDAAAAANAQAQEAMQAFERDLAQARAEARRIADQVRAEADAARAQQNAEAEQRLSKRLAAAEERLSAGRSARLDAARAAGDEAAKAIVAKMLPGGAA